jgi:hypothetical protein
MGCNSAVPTSILFTYLRAAASSDRPWHACRPLVRQTGTSAQPGTTGLVDSTAKARSRSLAARGSGLPAANVCAAQTANIHTTRARLEGERETMSPCSCAGAGGLMVAVTAQSKLLTQSPEAMPRTSARLPVLKYRRMSSGNARADEWCSCTADRLDTSKTSCLLLAGAKAPGASLLPVAAFC